MKLPSFFRTKDNPKLNKEKEEYDSVNRRFEKLDERVKAFIKGEEELKKVGRVNG